ncbi:hypothetical protein [Microcoleus sp. herbarium2]|uniref:hypothetical protein n=1 Tax=Microcoleus sp. herbarium2 TaxID=3055433 RepID=UPI002FD4853E
MGSRSVLLTSNKGRSGSGRSTVTRSLGDRDPIAAIAPSSTKLVMTQYYRLTLINPAAARNNRFLREESAPKPPVSRVAVRKSCIHIRPVPTTG